MIKAQDGHVLCCLNWNGYNICVTVIAILKWYACKKWTSPLRLVVILSAVPLHWLGVAYGRHSLQVRWKLICGCKLVGEGSGSGPCPLPRKKRGHCLLLRLVWAAGTSSHGMRAYLYLYAAATIKLSTWASCIHVNKHTAPRKDYWAPETASVWLCGG